MALTETEMLQLTQKVGKPRAHLEIRIPVNVEKAKDMLEAGFSWRQVAQAFECSPATIYNRLKGQTVRRQPPGHVPWNLEIPEGGTHG